MELQNSQSSCNLRLIYLKQGEIGHLAVGDCGCNGY